jgi:hypothetical protein
VEKEVAGRGREGDLMKQYRIIFEEEDEAPDLWDRSMYLSNVDEGTGQKRLYVSHVPCLMSHISTVLRGKDVVGVWTWTKMNPPKKLYKV